MAASSGRLCGPCDTRHATTVAMVWCTSCNEGLCTNCSEHHAASRGTNQHRTIPVSRYVELESFLTSIKQDCESHGRKFDLYCLDHSAPCCVSCIPVLHPKCKKVEPIDELSRQAMQSDELTDIERGFKELQISMNKIKSNRQNNLDKIEKQRSTIVKEIKSIKLKVNSYLDKLESEVLKDLAKTHQTEKAKIDDMLEQLKAKQQNIQQVVATLTKLNTLPDVQVFLASKQLERRLYKEEQWTTDICSDDKAPETDIKFRVEQQIERIISEIKTFGKIQVSRSPIQITVGAWKQQQAQINVPTSTVRQLEDINLQLVRQIEFEGNVELRDCCTLPDGKMIFVDIVGDKLLTYNEDGKFYKKISTGRAPFGLTVIDSNTVAVSCMSDKVVQIIDITGGRVKHKFHVNGPCRGISYNKGKLYVLVLYIGIEEYDVNGKLIRTIQVDVPTDNGYLCCCSDGYCYTSWTYPSGFIAYCDVNGQELWKSDIGDTSVTVDNNGHIFVTNFNTNSLYVMSADGRRHKRLLSPDDGLNVPEGVFYNKENNTLLVVTSYRREAALYRVVQ